MTCERVLPPRSRPAAATRLYRRAGIDRVAELRGDAAAGESSPPMRAPAVMLIGGELVVLKSAARHCDPLFSPAEARALGASRDNVFLGLIDGAPRFGFRLEPQSIEPLKTRNDLKITDLRSIAVQGMVEASICRRSPRPRRVLGWHARHRFCPNCGTPTRSRAGRLAARLPVLQRRAFSAHRSGGDHAGDRGRARRARPLAVASRRPCGRASRASSSRAKPSRRRCGARFCEEAGVALRPGQIFFSQPWPFPSSIMIGCHAQALSETIVVDREELEDARWFEPRRTGCDA